MAYWLLKTEPSSWSWEQQVAAKGDAWTGVRNPAAKRHLGEMRVGDRAFFYHTGEERRVVGVVEVVRAPYPDPTAAEESAWLAVDVRAVEPLPAQVTLAQAKADAALAGMALVRAPRLSVQPVSEAEWRRVCELGGIAP